MKIMERYWCKTYNGILNSNGFLNDQNDMMDNILSLKNIDSRVCVLLCPTINDAHNDFIDFYETEKSIHTEDIVLYHDLSSYNNEELIVSDIFRNKFWENWITMENNMYLFLEGIDICRKQIPTIAKILIREINNYKTYSKRLYIRIISASGLWDISLEGFLREFCGENNFLRLLIAPYTQEQIADICENKNIKAESFLKIVQEKELQPLAMFFLSLNSLCSDISKFQTMSLSENEVYFNACMSICNEFFCEYGTISPYKMFAIATRIAAIMVFCKKDYFSLDNRNNLNANILHIADIFEETELATHYVFSITYSDIIHTVRESGLFLQTQVGEFTFYHQAIQNYLAAKFIINHDFEKGKIISLFTNSKDDEGKLYEWVKGTHTWIQKITPKKDILEYFASHDPLNILKGEIIYNDEFKKKLVTTILEKFDTFEIIDDDWTLIRNNGEKLYHPDIIKQIKPYIINKEKNSLVRRNAMAIAEACLLTDLETCLWEIVKDKDLNEKTDIKEYAIHSLCVILQSEEELMNGKIIDEMKNYIASNSLDDENDNIKGNILKFLWQKNKITSDEVFKYLTLPKKNNYFGRYQMFLYHDLPNGLKTIDIENALNWIYNLKDLNDSHLIYHYSFEYIINKTIQLSWEKYPELVNKDLFSKVILLLIRSSLPIYQKSNFLQKNTKTIDYRTIDVESRLDVSNRILYVLSLEKPSNNYPHCELINSRLIVQDEYETIVKYASKTSPKTRNMWLNLLLCFNYADEKKRDMLKNWFPSETKGIFQHIFDPEYIKRIEQQTNKYEYCKTKEKLDKERGKKIIRMELQTCINQFEKTHSPEWWDNFFKSLGKCYSNGNCYINDISSDVTNYDNWTLLSDGEIKKAFKLSKYFIKHYDDKYEDFIGKNVRTYHASAGYKSLILILSLNGEDFIKGLNNDILNNWKNIIICYQENSSPQVHQKNKDFLVSLLFERIPKETVKIIEKILISENKEFSYLFTLRYFEKNFNEESQKMLFKLLEMQKLSVEATKQIISLLLQKVPDVAFKYIKDLPWEKLEQKIKIGYLSTLMEYVDDLSNKSNGYWDFIYKTIGNDVELEKECYLDFADPSKLFQSHYTKLNEFHLAEMYRKLYEIFPPEEDPKFDNVHCVSPRENIGYYRDRILRILQDRGTKESIVKLQNLRKIFPKAGIEFTIVKAKEQFRNKSFEPITPAAFQKFSHNGPFRIISNGGDLLKLIEESLERYELSLQGTQSMVLSLWNIVKDQNEAKPKDEEHLSNCIKNFLENDLEKYGINSYRETELRRNRIIVGMKPGEKVDILVDYNQRNNKCHVIIEVKGSWNIECETGMREQLLDRYMKTDRCHYGLYIIGWFEGPNYNNNKTFCTTIDKAKAHFKKCAEKLSNGTNIVKSFVLDCRLK